MYADPKLDVKMSPFHRFIIGVFVMGNRAGGWLIWLGIIILFNVLSYAFNWGYVIY